jgi:hypothetical protein
MSQENGRGNSRKKYSYHSDDEGLKGAPVEIKEANPG